MAREDKVLTDCGLSFTRLLLVQYGIGNVITAEACIHCMFNLRPKYKYMRIEEIRYWEIIHGAKIHVYRP